MGRLVVAGMMALLALGTLDAHAQRAGSERSGTTLETRAAADTVTYVDAPLQAVMADIRARTGVQFLYRDALIAGVRVTVRAAPDDLVPTLATAVERHGLSMQVDTVRNQALLTRAEASPPSAVTGQVLDATTGARLPLATVTWRTQGRRRGVATGDDGTFRLRLSGALARRDTLVFTVSYVGYEPQTVGLDPKHPPREVSVRLTPAQTEAPEVVVQSVSLQSTLDTTWQTLLRPERYAPLGEASVLSAMQTLPAVSLTPALAGGLTVRGSRDDGFHVMLDGMSVYNQQHLFGLFDAFNDDALQAVGFFYGVAPADYPAPPGGTLVFRTRTGSQQAVHVHAVASSTALSATAEGPLADGQGSWLVSGRHSILGADWFGNADLIAAGLDVDRATSPLSGGAEPLSDEVVLPGPPAARFFDVHGTLVWETRSAHRWRLSTYVGGDDAEQSARRIVRDDNLTRRDVLARDVVDTTDVETTNRWGTTGASLQWQRPVGALAFSHVTAAVSRYTSRYATDDFLYVRRRSGGFNAFTAPFRHDNHLWEGALTHRLSLYPSSPGTWTAGYALRLYDVAYAEDSALSSFDGGQKSVQTDAFAQYNVDRAPADLHVGLRVHYYSRGRYARVSPRLQIRIAPDRPLSAGIGYSRNHQFLHRLDLVNDVSSAVWIPSTEAQPPGLVDHLTAGVYARPSPGTALQVEAYWKEQRNLRLHDTFSRLRTSTSVLLDPWTVDNDAQAGGVEVLVQQTAGAVTATAAYTLSRVDVDPPGAGPSEPAPWDRRHQVTARLVGTLPGRASAHATWTYATGPPNPYADVLPRREVDRLGAYHRLDVGASVEGSASAVDWTVRAALFNAYARRNPWYRTPITVLRPDGPDRNRFREVGFALVDVYDLGLRPSVAVEIRW